jgi:hypothetical protein
MMSESSKDTMRATEAAKAVFDGRNPSTDFAPVLTTLEHAVATVLLALFPDPDFAAKMLNEGLVIGIENRLSLRKSKTP